MSLGAIWDDRRSGSSLLLRDLQCEVQKYVVCVMGGGHRSSAICISLSTEFYRHVFVKVHFNVYPSQSYGGKYVPAVAHCIHKLNPLMTEKINLKGIAIGDAYSDPESVGVPLSFLFCFLRRINPP